jgi:hypothetical protein
MMSAMSSGKPGHPARKKDRFNRFKWRDAVFADPKTPANAKCLAFGIANYINGETGDARVSTITLAKNCGFSEKWVRKTIPVLRATGWMEVEFGSQGRGDKHCNRYRINRKKRPPCTVLKASPVFGFVWPEKGTVKPDFSHLKPDPVFEEPLNHKEEASANALAVLSLDRGGVTETENTADAAPPVKRAGGSALTETVAEQPRQPSPSRASPEMGPPANASASAHPHSRLRFDNVVLAYPQDRVGDEAEAYRVFCSVAPGRRLNDLVEAVQRVVRESGAHVPWLSEALAMIERGQARRSGRQ